MPTTLFCCINCYQNLSDKEIILSMITRNLNVITVHSEITEMQIKGRVLISKCFMDPLLATTSRQRVIFLSIVMTKLESLIHRDDKVSSTKESLVYDPLLNNSYEGRLSPQNT